jgi:acetate---CoA ligase (ADP-forming) subunit beta
MGSGNGGAGLSGTEEIIEKSLSGGKKNLSEFYSKRLVAEYGAPVVDEWLCADAETAAAAAEKAGWPVALKLCSPDVAHKKEKGFVALGLADRQSLIETARRMLDSAKGIDIEGLLVQRMIRGERELLAGMRRDPVFGVCVTIGMGGIFTEAMNDISVRVAPVSQEDVEDMLDGLKTGKIFENYRGLAKLDRGAIARTLIGLGEIGLKHPKVDEIDINPMIVDSEGKPVAVDALVILNEGGGK